MASFYREARDSSKLIARVSKEIAKEGKIRLWIPSPLGIGLTGKRGKMDKTAVVE